MNNLTEEEEEMFMNMYEECVAKFLKGKKKYNNIYLDKSIEDIKKDIDEEIIDAINYLTLLRTKIKKLG